MVDKKDNSEILEGCTIVNGDNITFLNELSEGGQGEVYVAKYLINNEYKDVVVKRYKYTKKDDFTEIIAYKKLGENELMVKLFGYFFDEQKKLNLVLEQAFGKELQEYLDDEEDDNCLPYDIKLKILIKLCDFLAYLRKCHTIHRDLKPENIKIIYDRETNHFEVKILDFGITKISENTFTFTMSNNRFTINYSAPELYTIDKAILSHKVDVWALGCIISYMFTGIVPWSNKSKNIVRIQSALVMKENFPIPDECKGSIRRLVELCTNVSPERRVNAETIGKLARKMLEGEEILDIELLDSNYT